MKTNRLEAFSDGVIAIIITIMVLGLQVPHGHALSDLKPLIPTFTTYILSFIYLGIYWNNHHHLLAAAKSVTGLILWANLHLLFWLSLFPFFTGWIGSSKYAKVPTFLYGCVLLGAAFAFFILQGLIVRGQGEGSLLKIAIGKDFKGKISLACYATGILFAPFIVWVSISFFIVVAVIWVIPDRRLETYVKSLSNGE